MTPARFCAALLLLGGPVACARQLYVGANLTLLTDGRCTSPLFGVQGGVPLGSRLELHGAFETVVLGSSLSADLLYRAPFNTLDVYFGAGLEVLFAPGATITPAQRTPLGDPNAGLHATAGLALRTGSVGIFGEVQPILMLEPVRLVYTKVRSGINVHLQGE